MEAILRAHLLKLSVLMDASGVSPATIGKRALNDNTFFGRLADESSTFNVRTYDRVLNWIADNWPAGTEWPADVPRPASAAGEAA